MKHRSALSLALILLFPGIPVSTDFLNGTFMANGSMVTVADDEQEDGGESDLELEELGAALKAAVMSGNMSEEEGRAIWHTAVAQVKGEEAVRQKKNDQRGDDDEYDDTKARDRIGRLVPPAPEEPSMLIEPEFLPRDVQLLSNWLELDKERTLIVEMILRDYGQSMSTLTAGLLPALRRYKQADDAREMQQMLAHLENEVLPRQIDMESASKVIGEQVRGYAEEHVAKQAAENGEAKEDLSVEIDARATEWTNELTSALQNIDTQMSLLRDRMKDRVNAVDIPEGQVTSRDLVLMAEAIKIQRQNLRQDVIDMLKLALVVDDELEEQARLDSALARLRIEHGFRHARMGGEYINPWSLARDFKPEGIDENPALDLLVEHQTSLADLAQERTDAAILRELEGLRLLVARDDLVEIAGNEDNVPLDTWYEVLEPFTESWHAQVDASIDYRDHVLQLIQQTRQVLAQQDSSLSDRYYDDAMRRGFGSEMRARWSERALQKAMAIETLDEETTLVLQSLQEETLSTLRNIRSKAIERRLKRDPELSRKPILSLWKLDDSQGKPWIREDWTGHELEAHQELNKHVEYSLKALLTPEQFETVPTRRNTTASKKGGKGGKGGKGT